MREIEQPHYARVFDKYDGIWCGEIRLLWAEYKMVKEQRDQLLASAKEIVDSCDGDTKAVHVPHDKFRKLRIAVYGP